MRTILIALTLTALVGCGKKDAGSPQASDSTNAVGATSQTASPPSATGTNADAANALRAAQNQIAKPDPSVPKENYTAVDRAPGDTWATYAAVAFDDRTLDDKTLLNLLSGRYFNEHDAFKQQEMAATELAPIKERLAAYKKQRYYSIPFGLYEREVINPTISFSGPYDFEKKSFLSWVNVASRIARWGPDKTFA